MALSTVRLPPPRLLRLCVGAASSYPEARRLLWGFHAQMNTSDLCPFSTVTSSFGISTGSFAAHPETYWKAGVGGGWRERGERGGEGDGGVHGEWRRSKRRGGEGRMSERSEVRRRTSRRTRLSRETRVVRRDTHLVCVGGRAGGTPHHAKSRREAARGRADAFSRRNPQTHLLRPYRRRRPLPVPCMCVVGTA